jgi:predicted DNA-binding transcriptional regulator AlpA
LSVIDTDPLADFPTGGFVREATILKFIPVHRSTLWRWVKTGGFPSPRKLGGVTAWSAAEVREHLLPLLSKSDERGADRDGDLREIGLASFCSEAAAESSLPDAPVGARDDPNSKTRAAAQQDTRAGRHRDRREAQALAYLRRRGCASALEIGNAAVQGESRSRQISQHGKESIGLSIAVALVRRGIIQTTRGNQFRLP